MRKPTNPNHGWPTASKNQRSVYAINTRQGGGTCGSCAHFEECKKLKGIKEDTDYCQWPPHKKSFKKKEDSK